MTSTLGSGPYKVLIIDDDADWRELISEIASFLGHSYEVAPNLTKAEEALQRAEQENVPFSVVTIDWLFELGKDRRKYPDGRRILSRIKTQYPYLACIMVSGEPDVAHRLLELRDRYNLDSYVSKTAFNDETFQVAIEKAMKRVQEAETEELAETAVAAPDPQQHNLAKIYESMVDAFSEEELMDLCFRLEIDFERLPGHEKGRKIRELIFYLNRRSRISEMIALLHQLRPNVSW